MNFFYKIYDALCVDIFEYILRPHSQLQGWEGRKRNGRQKENERVGDGEEVGSR